jgi:tetratricopeptide (TPR) repeat protein
MKAGPTDDRFGNLPLGRAIALIVVAGLVAYHGSLRSCFYLDDGWQIEDSPWVEGGGWYRWTFRSAAFLTHWLTWKLWGLSGPAFHAGNLALHLLNAVLLRQLLEEISVRALGEVRARAFSFWSALLFVVHPLGSEIPNYVRARDIEMVLTFSLVAGCGGASLARARRIPAFVAFAVGLIGATFSKEIGFPCALLAAAGGFLVASPEKPGLSFAGHRRLAAALGFLLVAGGISFFLTPAGTWAIAFIGDPRLWFHVLTQARIFWQLAGLFAYPVHLCSDHLVAWTVAWNDARAWVALAALATALVLAALLFRRGKRLAGFLALGVFFPLLLHFPLVSSELMVEYRAYPALPFGCALAVLLLCRIRDRMDAARSRLAPTVVLSVLCVALAWLSWRRTAEWRDPQTLAQSTLREYPLQARAINGLAWHYAEHGEPARALALHTRTSAILDQVEQWNRDHAQRKLDSGHYLMNRIGDESAYALALARNGDPAAGEKHMLWLKERLVGLKLDRAFLWNDYYSTLAQIREAAGDFDAAITDYRTALDYAGRAFSYGQDPYLYRQEKSLQRLLKTKPGASAGK